MLTSMTRLLIVILTAALCAGAAIGFQNPLRDRLLRNERAQEVVGWYQRADTGEFFLFDRSNTVALLSERDDPTGEVLVLFANRAPGGGTAYVTDTGREVVRLTGLGGATYFPTDAPNGVIADFASEAGGLAPPPRSTEEVRLRAEDLANELTAELDRSISVGYAPAPRAGLGVQHDSLHMIALAFRSLRNERRRLRGIDRVEISIGEQPAAYRRGNSLIVVIAPEFGFAGRSSSAFIARSLLAEDRPT
ncbi:protein of unknown function [Maricaulis salignorans]|uniref:DUF4908 domain-containing protein n=2 Tax=Maricaulis salignorans TaxID=144026 RepID=A0A1G9USE5_9PROT|nr:protein of unknown function [Maricaulis salignorans]